MKTKLILGSLLAFSVTSAVWGQSSSYNANPSALSGFDNTGLGGQAMQSMYFGAGSGNGNTAIGHSPLWSNVSGNNNTVLGAYSLFSNTAGNDNVSIGYFSMFNSQGNANIAIGSNALNSINLANDNIAIGFNALNNNTASENIAIGTEALFQNTGGTGLTAIGYKALIANTSGSENTALGYNVLKSNTTGQLNTAVGNEALSNNTSGSGNTAHGYQALYNNTADGNVANGFQALYSNLTGTANVGTGYKALFNNIAADRNSAFGYEALMNNIAEYNVGVGFYSLQNNRTGEYNTAIGSLAMNLSQVATHNTAIGFAALGGVAYTGSQNTALGIWTGLSALNLNFATAVGSQAVSNANHRLWLGNVATTVWTNNSYNISDGRFKKNIEEEVKGIEFIKLLRPVTYNLDARKFTEHITQNMPDSVRKNYFNLDFNNVSKIRQTGFIAQEVEEAAKKAGYNFSGVYSPDKDNNTDTYGISYYQFVVPLVKAVQEQQAMIEAQKQANETLLKRIETLEKMNGVNKANSINGLDNNTSLGSGFNMGQNEPNPFTHETVIPYTIPEQVNSAYMTLYDLSGKQVASFQITKKGSSSIKITSEKIAAGMYIYSIVADGKVVDSKRMIVAER